MSTSGNGDPTDGGQEGGVSPTGEWAQMAQEGGGMGDGSGPQECDVAPVAEEVDVAGPGMVEAVEGEGGPAEEYSEQALVLAPHLEGNNTDEDSDIGPAEEEPGDQNMSQGLIVDAHQFPMVGFRFMFLDLVHTLLHRLHYNDHILIRSGHHLIVRPRSPGPNGSGELLAIPVPQRPRVMAAALEGEGEGLGAGLSRAPSIVALEEPEDMAAAFDSDEPLEEGSAVSTEQDAEEVVKEMAVETADKVAEGPAKDNVEHDTLLSEQDDEHSEDKDKEDIGKEDEEGAEEDRKEENQSN